MMQLRTGIYYLAADGTKRGPIGPNLDGTFVKTHPWRDPDGRTYMDCGKWDLKGSRDDEYDLIAEWVDAATPEVGTPNTDATLAADLRAKLSEAAAIATQLDAAGWTVEVIMGRKTSTTGADALTLTANITRMKEERL